MYSIATEEEKKKGTMKPFDVIFTIIVSLLCIFVTISPLRSTEMAMTTTTKSHKNTASKWKLIRTYG